MGEAKRPEVYSIAAHRGFADALVAGLVPRYSDPEIGLAGLTLLLPSSRAARSISEAFIRHAGEEGQQGLLMPRMVMVGDVDLPLLLLFADTMEPFLEPSLPQNQLFFPQREVHQSQQVGKPVNQLLRNQK